VPDYKSSSSSAPGEDVSAVSGQRHDVDYCEREGLVVGEGDEFTSLAAIDLQPQVHLRATGGREVMSNATEMEAYYGYEKYEGSASG